ncbi:MAG: hypothetical protein HC892_20465 [Saprospiraceae bacterium]|nr:hypothetical protein [Saprospiraceae bacterium]
MDATDHKQTGSWGKSKAAKEFRKQETELLKQGDLKGAQKIGVEDVKKKFPGKYDKAIGDALNYTDELNKKKKN